MDINADFNINSSGGPLLVLHKKEDEAAASDTENFNEKAKRLKTEENVIMELKDVQNFLYMLIGVDLKIMKPVNLRGDMLNLSA